MDLIVQSLKLYLNPICEENHVISKYSSLKNDTSFHSIIDKAKG